MESINNFKFKPNPNSNTADILTAKLRKIYSNNINTPKG